MIRNRGGQSRRQRKRGYSFNERDQKCSYVNLTPVSVIKFASPMIFVSLTRNATTCNALIRRNLQSEETTTPSDHLRARFDLDANFLQLPAPSEIVDKIDRRSERSSNLSSGSQLTSSLRGDVTIRHGILAEQLFSMRRQRLTGGSSSTILFVAVPARFFDSAKTWKRERRADVGERRWSDSTRHGIQIITRHVKGYFPSRSNQHRFNNRSEE